MAIKDYLAKLASPRKADQLAIIRARIDLTHLGEEHSADAFERFESVFLDNPKLAKEYFNTVRDDLLERIRDARAKRR